ncbi:protein-tyrosine-phosphatase MKP1 isoform X1 [Elaeis guineensis]|uniref:Protein-tyrosine-phosphatase MKP1 isoform X2 n=1 Tax=Elaeis guineensis var. tenera TaxID=51953 RepID=A0A6I9RPS0_ELAGV|nr:protein-tyrosine-phosphatase MKP1 isoform X2 [Elaeis guineensis]
MDSEDAPTPRRSLWRSASWTARSSPTSQPNPHPNPARPPAKPGRLSLPPLQPLSVARRPVLNEWPRPGSDDSGEWPLHRNCPPATPSAAGSSPSAAARECSRVAEHVYLGSDVAARDRDVLRLHGITHVLNCVGSASPEYFRGELVYKTLWLHDSPAEDITSVLYDAFDYLEDVRLHCPDGRVLVHCRRGASRSAALVIAYLMWRHAISFDDALRRVRAARAVTDPNLGFAAQLLQCQSRVHALPPSPGSALRAYRMAPHSPYDPLHLVPKAVADPLPRFLDSRGAFLVHVQTAIYVWVGRDCEPTMAASAGGAALQVVRYERAQGPIVTVPEGSEPPDFWAALRDPNSSSPEATDLDVGEVGKRRVELYDLDFEIFRRALKGGVVPPFPMPGTEAETRLPARESGWSRLRHKFLKGGIKELVTAAAAAEVEGSSDEQSVTGDQVRSPGSFSVESSTTPSSSSADSASTMFSFSPASSSSSDWYNSSPPRLDLLGTPLVYFDSRSPPLQKTMGREKDASFSVSSSAPRSLAERRGTRAPSLVLSPEADEKKAKISPSDIVRDWCLSPPFISELEEDRGTMDIEQRLSLDSSPDRMDAEEESVSTEGHAWLTHAVLFRWPDMEKVEIIHPGVLDSESVFVLLAPESKSGRRKTKMNTMYVWLGRESQQMSYGSGSEMSEGDVDDRHTYLDRIGAEFFHHMGLPANIPVQIIREGNEPEQFLNHLFSFHQANKSSQS